MAGPLKIYITIHIVIYIADRQTWSLPRFQVTSESYHDMNEDTRPAHEALFSGIDDAIEFFRINSDKEKWTAKMFSVRLAL